jgi:GntR family transcriptional regulator of vanillate catabolism
MVTRTQRVTAVIRDLVLSGALPPGARLQETEMAKRLGVSRTPVREALGILVTEGLLEHAPNCGCVVRRISLQDVLDLFDLRATLEAMAARIVAERGISAGELAMFRENLEAAEAVFDGAGWSLEQEARWNELNSAFHGRLVDLTGNRALADAVRQSRRFPLLHGPASEPHDSALLRQSYGNREHCRVSMSEHRLIVEAIFHRESGRAEHLMREHVYRNRDALRRVVEAVSARRAAA